jgi:predicted enzyme related to lactoylglutathione lyase
VPESSRLADRGSAVYFKVVDIHDVFETLQSRGVAMGNPPHVVHRTPTMELWLCEFTDPDGNHLALMSEKTL